MHMDSGATSSAPFTPQPIPPSTERFGDEAQVSPAQWAGLVAENHELCAELERLRTDRAHLAQIQARLMDVLGCKSPDRLVHDVRNVLNERDLYRALANTLQD